ncbi:hypothetical protein SARC_00631 [Sphaeroforma arctica JP610]|uniref:Uncharacterized protein n=1 Tax=Sphaeroforma arctica JP610 TaxID=667725 RepID=A0A0L0GE06_9EUKA|nr:hypothetical protein SARC_00631 [Sphaeroforma arctica JP610]KNC87245.1 hypothetical protein SARC_00631 [Sphaeroforma arctica JP610]|eukprot:XP_014161147.1 hypothetical protein SARC_00631 [Sphaeroforma arctica JP610]
MRPNIIGDVNMTELPRKERNKPPHNTGRHLKMPTATRAGMYDSEGGDAATDGAGDSPARRTNQGSGSSQSTPGRNATSHCITQDGKHFPWECSKA